MRSSDDRPANSGSRSIARIAHRITARDRVVGVDSVHMRRVLVLVGVLSVGACSNEKMHLHPDGVLDTGIWQPKPGETQNWDIQVNAPIDLSVERAMMIVDLWASVPSDTMIDYGDGAPVSVPAGSEPSTMATLKARPTVIICRVGLGGVKTSDPDYAKFPAGAIGTVPTAADPDERYLDLNQRDAWEDVAFARLDLAKQIGCEGIEPYLADHDLNVTGFMSGPDIQSAWAASIALEVHQRKMSAGARNGSLTGLTGAMAQQFDWQLVERCGELTDCDPAAGDFLNARKAVFAIDYDMSLPGDQKPPAPPRAQDPATLCEEQIKWDIRDGLVKDVALSSTFRFQCE
jgi:hypothetical protein